MNRKVVTAIFALSAVLAISALAQAQSGTDQQTGLTNPGFEEPRGKEANFALVETMPGWKTTDTHFEIWGTGFKEVAAHEGTQFVELNAYIDGTLYQDSTGIEPEAVLEFTFAHRGRSGEDTMKLTITDLGADNAMEGGDDTVLFTKEYTTGKDAWAVYTSTKEPKIKAIGNTVRFAYGAISTATGELGEGNLLDAANFGIGVVSARRDRVAAASAPKSSGTVVVWGRNEKGQTEVPAGLTDVTAISAGTAHCMALKRDGTVVAWGDNTSEATDVPAGLRDVIAIASAGHNLALKQDGTVVAWGSNTSEQADVPAGLSDVMAIAAGGEISLALKKDGTVVKWGLKDQITQRGEFVDRLAVPEGLSDVTAISAEGRHCMALKRDGTVVSWGVNEHGQSDVPEGLNGVVAIEVTYFDCLALKKDGTVVAWGGLYDDGKLKIPDGLSDVAAISGGSFHTMALKRDGAVVVWGSVYPEREHGQSVVPTGLSGVTRIAAGDYFSMALVSGQQTDTTPLLTTTKSGSTKVSAGTTNSIGMEFKLIPAGTFMMGSPENEVGRLPDEQHHEVTIARDYYMGITEVTQSQWQQVMGTTPWQGQEQVIEGNDIAASYISWNDAVEFCRKLSQQEGRTYRLPTEAEWEYACRGGTTTAYSFGDDASQLEQSAWSRDSEPNHSSQLKQKIPNGFGLYDMHGNLLEFCQDWYGAYPQGSVTDPAGPSSGTNRVGRGGHYMGEAHMSRSAARQFINDSARQFQTFGLRVVMVPGSDFSSGQLAPDEAPPENAMKLDVEGGAFAFGYRTTAEPGFTEFPNTDSPHPGITRRNRTDGEYFSYAQNTRETEVIAQESSLVHYPAKAEGSGVLCPGQNPGDIAIARFTAMNDGEYHFKISAQLIEEDPTGAGVTIYVGSQAVEETQLKEHLVPWTTSSVVKLKKGQTVDIAVDSGLDKNWEKDHVLVTAKAWTTGPSSNQPEVGATWSGEFFWEGANDPPGKNPGQLTLLEENKVRYSYQGGLHGDFDLQRKEGEAGTAWITLADGNRLRFTWVDSDAVLAHFWFKDDNVANQPARAFALLHSEEHKARRCTVDQARELLIGNWKINSEKTRELNPHGNGIHDLPEPIIAMQFTKDHHLLVKGNDKVLRREVSYQVMEAGGENHFHLGLEGEPHFAEISFVDQDQMILAFYSYHFSMVLDRAAP